MELFQYLNYACFYFVVVLFLKILWSRRKFLRIVAVTFKRDMVFSYTSFGIMLVSWGWKRLTNETVFKSLDKSCKRRGMRERTCFFYEEEKWTYGQVQAMSFQVANFFQGLGYKKGDVIGLAMQNRPEVVCIWLGLSRIGVITALINFNLRGDSLEHCVKVGKCKSVIFGSEMREAFKEIWLTRQQRDTPQHDVIFYELDRYLDGSSQISQSPRKSSMDLSKPSVNSSSSHFTPNDFATCLRTTSSLPTKLRRGDEQPFFLDPCLYIFTSGTTGMPKAALSTHSRLQMTGTGVAMAGLSSKRGDIAYCPLPLNHTFALSGIMWAIAHEIPMVIIPKFSASKFWRDMHYYKATACLYMGELCRFIVNQPPQPSLETNHSLHTMYGCGVKPEVWEAFTARFNIRKFVELYGSTEGNCTIVNMEGTKVGAVGFIPVWVQPFYSVLTIRVDEVTGEILRDKDTGYAIRCQNGEAGEMVGKIVNFFPSLRYDGYTNKEANEKKIAKNLFRQGDRYFRSGDLMTKDEYGYFYFSDRIGDTFRWKGENVSTAEVEGIILRLTDMKTTVVYGVKVPGTEGRCGMAAIADPEGNLDLKRLAEGLEKGLPSYARPIFVRVIRGDNVFNMTGTFKLQKFNLQNDGFDIEKVADDIFIYDGGVRGYRKLEGEEFRKIKEGNYRF